MEQANGSNASATAPSNTNNSNTTNNEVVTSIPTPSYWAPIKKEKRKREQDQESHNRTPKEQKLDDVRDHSEEKKENELKNNEEAEVSQVAEKIEEKEKQKSDERESKNKRNANAPQPLSKKAKKRERKKIMEAGGAVCSLLINGEECPYGDKCKYSHDLQGYFEKRPPDLLSDCVLYDRYGICPFGIKCRYGGSHLSPNGENKKKDDTIPRNLPLNILSKDLQKQLWKNMKEFPKSEAWIRKDQQEQQERKRQGAVVIDSSVPHEREVIPLNLKGKLILAPLTTIGNLPYRVICKGLGADVTCGEMAVATHLLAGQKSEWALIKRDPCEDFFGIQLAAAHRDPLMRCAELLNEQASFDYIDINCGCPIDVIYNKGMGSALLDRAGRLESMVRGAHAVLDKPLTIKIRTGRDTGTPTVHKTLVPYAHLWGASAITIHGRSREQRYTKEADWQFIDTCAQLTPLPVIGNGDIYSWQEAVQRMETTHVSSLMLARGAIIKPWLFTEIKERRDWDISAGERLELVKKFCHLGLDHWGSDDKGVETTRQFLLNWMSFLHRYIPIGILETLPSQMNQRPPPFVGRNELETLLASPEVKDWIHISEMFLGAVPHGYHFVPKHKNPSYKDDTNAVATAEVEG